MPTMEIKRRFDGSVLYSGEALSLIELLENAVRDHANLRGANLDGANLRGANLRGANLDGANLDGANLRGANLDGANLDGANLRGANLDGANLDGANLRGANLDGANLRGANLDDANLRGANLDGANLDGANLRGANLDGANLDGANLRGANIGEKLTIQLAPILISIPTYHVIIFDSHMSIGCKFYSLSEWFAFDDHAIIAMDGKRALEFWRKWKAPLQAICTAEGRA